MMRPKTLLSSPMIAWAWRAHHHSVS